MSRAPPYKIFMELPLSIKILDTRKFPMSRVTIKASLCRKCMVDALASENKQAYSGLVDPLESGDRWLSKLH